MSESETRKDTYHHGHLREELIRRGLNALEQEGAEALSLRALAESAGVSKTAPYRHFKDKEEFLLVRPPQKILQDKCKKCLACVRTGCPNITAGDQITINPYECTGCTVCKQACPFEAIVPIEEGGAE